MLTATEIQKIINQRIESLSFPATPADLYDPIQYILSLGGKRLRPTLTLMACNLFSDEVELAIEPALGIELFHNFTLLHDDIMDKADKRRGHLTVHRKWNENVAILSGDAMQIEAYRHISLTSVANLPRVLARFSQTAIEVCEGQQIDMDFEKRCEVPEEDYLEMIRLKTAVLVAASLQIGAWMGGATEQEAGLLYDFGSSLGLAFQLQDDLLDVYGDAKTFGKNIGGDIVSNKKTFLLILAMNSATGSIKESLLRWIKEPVVNPEEKIKAVTEIYDTLGIGSICKKQIASFHEKAFVAFDKLGLPLSRKQILIDYVSALMQRQT
ncbi:polyprenyl synthetase family protein [Microbacter margulisiae]|uniref:Geranylgeranyl diphosphate synthase type II n=1 Tax=Microbacter margulisiae TaxID=1350067 RepID=A0A7W5H249_9PORP|nr:polyprenyl synthetase family protein [Microbacter margulisiae]MBB3188313.1 geranylgeranyl diphosphate synthase type II [Microbacter margulisiae]